MPTWDQRIVTASDDHTSRVWNSADGRLLTILQGDSDPLWAVTFSPDGNRILTLGNNSVRIWDSANGRLLAVFLGDRFRDAAFSPDGQRIVTGGYDPTARVWRMLTLDDIAQMLAK
jgi:WD40 repeat protein